MGKRRSISYPTEPVALPLVRDFNEPVKKRGKWTNKQRVLVLASRVNSYRNRHFMADLRTLIPQAKSEFKKERKDGVRAINEIGEMKNCNKCCLF